MTAGVELILIILLIWQLSGFSARRKSCPRTAEDLLGSMWNAVRSNNGIMVRLRSSLGDSCIHYTDFTILHVPSHKWIYCIGR